MKKIKSFITMLLAVVMVLTAIPPITLPANAATSGHYTYYVKNGEAEIRGCDTAISGDVTLPDTLDGYPVTSIGKRAFSGCSSLQSVILPDGVTNIGDSAFRGCTGLTSIRIPDSVTMIGDNAFWNCSGLTQLTIGNGIISIGEDAFCLCSSLQAVVLPEGLQSIGADAFYLCDGIQGFEVPKSVTQIGERALNGDGVQYLNVDAENPVYHSKDNCIIHTGEKRLVTGCKASIIPADGSVVTIGKYAFAGVKMGKRMVVPSAVTTIGDHAFESCQDLYSVYLSEGVETIGDSVFEYCFGLNRITVPESVKSIGENSMRGEMIIHEANAYAIEYANNQGLDYTVGCLVEFIDTDGSLLKRTVYQLGDVVEVPHKDPTDQYAFVTTYDKLVETVCSGSALYTALSHEPVDRNYTITFKDWDGTVLSTDSYHYGDVINVPADPEKPEDDEYVYIFTGWTPEVGACVGDKVYTATYACKHKGAPDQPSAKYVSVTKVELAEVAGCEYSMDGVIWQDSPIFKGLTKNTEYSFYQRYKETTVGSASPISPALVVRTPAECTSDPVVTINSIPTYTGLPVEIIPVVTMEGELLAEGVDYTLSYENNVNAGENAVVIVTGVGNYDGVNYRKSFRILPADIAGASIVIEACSYSGSQKTPTPKVEFNGVTLSMDTDYVVQYSNNVDVGYADIRIIGSGNFCGMVDKTFSIHSYNKTEILKGYKYPSVYNSSITMSPGEFKGIFDCGIKFTCGYRLIDVSTGAVLKDVSSTPLGYASSNYIYYDFTNNMHQTTPKNYSLAYSWTDYNGNSYCGMMTIIVYAGPETPTAIELTQAPETDFRKDYLSVKSHWSTDAGYTTWRTSDETIATVDHGVVEWKKPGTVTITVSASGLNTTKVLTQEILDISNADMLWDATNKRIGLVYHGQVLAEGTDYIVAANTTDKYIEFTASGCGLFSGTLARRFVPETGAQYYDNFVVTFMNEDGTIIDSRSYNYGDNILVPEALVKPEDDIYTYEFVGWDAVVAKTCSGDAVYTAVFKAERKFVCGDLDGNGEVNEDDVIYLLQHLLMPEDFTVTQPVDYDKSGSIDEDDVIYLLQHLLMPEEFPL